MNTPHFDDRLDPVLEERNAIKRTDMIGSALILLGTAAVAAYVLKSEFFPEAQQVKTRQQVARVIEPGGIADEIRQESERLEERERRQDELVSGAAARYLMTFESGEQAEEYLNSILKRLNALRALEAEQRREANKALVAELDRVMGALSFLSESGEADEWCSQVNLRLALLDHADRCDAYHRYIQRLRNRGRSQK